jgi:hypothetical protein
MPKQEIYIHPSMVSPPLMNNRPPLGPLFLPLPCPIPLPNLLSSTPFPLLYWPFKPTLLSIFPAVFPQHLLLHHTSHRHNEDIRPSYYQRHHTDRSKNINRIAPECITNYQSSALYSLSPEILTRKSGQHKRSIRKYEAPPAESKMQPSTFRSLNICRQTY